LVALDLVETSATRHLGFSMEVVGADEGRLRWTRTGCGGASAPRRTP